MKTRKKTNIVIINIVELKYIKDMQNIKKELLNNLGLTSVFFFFNEVIYK